MSTPADNVAGLYLDAPETFANVVTAVEPSGWGGPGLGAWDLRGLVGHTSRALVTVLAYLDEPADIEAIDSAEQYYALATDQFTDAAAVVQRGRRAGQVSDLSQPTQSGSSWSRSARRSVVPISRR